LSQACKISERRLEHTAFIFGLENKAVVLVSKLETTIRQIIRGNQKEPPTLKHQKHFKMSTPAECNFSLPTLNCPCVISAVGTYKLLQDVTCTGCADDTDYAAIKIKSNKVILDLNDKTLSGDCRRGIDTTSYADNKVFGGNIDGFVQSVVGDGGADNFIVDRVSFTGGPDVVLYFQDSKKLQVHNSVFDLEFTNGISAGNVEDVTVTDNSFINVEKNQDGIDCTPCLGLDAKRNIFSLVGRYSLGIYLSPGSKDINIDNNCFFGPTDVNPGADAALEGSRAICVVDPTTTMTTITNNSFNTLDNGVYFLSIDGSDNSVLEENCFTNNKIALNFEETLKMHEYGPNNDYFDQLELLELKFINEFCPNNFYYNQDDYLIQDSVVPCILASLGGVIPNPPAPAPPCIGKKSKKLFVPPPKPFDSFCPCGLNFTEVPRASPSASPNNGKLQDSSQLHHMFVAIWDFLFKGEKKGNNKQN